MTYLDEPPAWFFPRILVGSGAMLTRRFADTMNITHVINCADMNATPLWFRMFRSEHIAVLNARDSTNAHLDEWYSFFEYILLQYLRSPGSQTIFIHCQCGINRAPSLSALYVMKNYNISWNQLRESVLRQRPCMFTNHSFRNQLETFSQNKAIRNGHIPSSETQDEFRDETESIGDT